MRKKYSNHNLAIDQIAKELGVKRSFVNKVISECVFDSINSKIKYPNEITIPYIGKLVPDMRRYTHVEERMKQLEIWNKRFKSKKT